jgi:predicted transcriptional regulator
MGVLRVEPKRGDAMSREEYRTFSGILKNAREKALANHIYFDLEDGENPVEVKKKFQFVAEQEEIEVVVRRLRGTNSLSFNFPKPVKILPAKQRLRLSANEARKRILEVLGRARGPLQKSEIIRASGISASTWNARIRELLENGSVVRLGNRRETSYQLRTGKK